MEVYAEGFAPREVDFAIVEKNPTVLNITLRRVRLMTYIECSYISTTNIVFTFYLFAKFYVIMCLTRIVIRGAKNRFLVKMSLIRMSLSVPARM